MRDNQIDMFSDCEIVVSEHYDGMPEYNNISMPEAEITAKFKFKNKDDFNSFMEVVKAELYNGKRVFDGNQRVNEYQAWFPLPPRPSDFLIVDGAK